MSLSPQQLGKGLVAVGFPSNISPAEVAGNITRKTGAEINEIAPLTDADQGFSGWLLLLRSHDDQKRCLTNFKTFEIQWGSQRFHIKLDIPQCSFTPYLLDWISVNKEDEKMDYQATEDIYGDASEKEAEYDNENIAHGTTDSHKKFVANPQVAEGYPGYPQNIEPQPQHLPHHREDHQRQHPQYPYGSNPQLSDLEPDGAANPRFLSKGQDPFSQKKNSCQKPYSTGRGRGLMNSNRGQLKPSIGFTGLGSNPMYMTPTDSFLQENHTQEGADLSLRGDSDQSHYPPEHHLSGYRDAQMMSQIENEFQSDFVVLDSPSEAGSDHRHHFHLHVTDLPDAVSEQELRDFFQDRKQSGGGPVIRVVLHQSTKSADIFFADEEVIDRVKKRSPLLLKEKKIHVEAASTELQKEEPEIKTVEIRGLESEDDTEICTYYFENPAKGGGDIESSRWNDQDRIFFITFEDPEVAKAVVSRGHTVANKVLEVSLYTPPAEEPEDTQPQCTVEVRKFDPKKQELYELYFSNPNKGGGPIVSLTVSDDGSVMSITFETPEVAQRVAEMSHKVGGRELDVIIAPVEDSSPPCTVVIKGCDLSDAELYEMYFESPKKGGGEITQFSVDENQQAIFVTFSDPEVAQTVVSRQHKIGGRSLEVSLFTEKKGAGHYPESKEPAMEEEEALPRTVMVSVGQGPLKSKDTYILYFESARHEGGEVETVDIDNEKKLVYITFAEHSVAERVAGKQHKISGHAVETKLYIAPKPRPTYPNKLLFKNVADTTSYDCLFMYLERVTEQEPIEILYGDEIGTVLVTFKEEPDYAATQHKCQQRPLEKRTLTVSKVPISNCILVENLRKVTTEDTIALYFENKRSKGGPVEKVEMFPEENKCLVYFGDHEVLDGVLSKSHKIDGSDLVVKRYLECLGQSGGSSDPTAFTMPSPLVLDNIDLCKIAFLRQSPTAKRGFLQGISACHAQVKFEGNTLIFDCTLTSAVPKARIIARTWTVDVQQNVAKFLDLIEVKKHQVMQQLWKEVEEAVKNTVDITSLDGVLLFPIPEESTFVVVGMKSMVKEVYDKLSTAIKEKEDEIERKKQEVTETNSNLRPHQLQLLYAIGFHMEAGKRHEGLKIDIIKKKGITFHGQVKDVKEAQVEMYDLLQTVRSDYIRDMSEMQRKVLDAKETKPYIIQKFKTERITAVWEQEQQNDITVSAFDDKSLVKAVHIIRKSVPEHVCQLSPQSSQLLSSRNWQDLKLHLTKAHQGILLIVPSQDNLQLFITCTDNIMHAVVEEIDKFIRENTVYSQVVCFSPCRQQFIHDEWKQEVDNMAVSLRAYQLQISWEASGTKIHIRGTVDGLEEMKKRLKSLNDKILVHEEVYTDQNKVKLLTSDCEKDLMKIGRMSQCVLALKPEPAEMRILESDSQTAVAPVQATVNIPGAASIQIQGGVTISVIQGDLTQMAVDAIVNAANNRMDHIGGLARDIVTKGGEVIQQECFKLLKGKQLKEGDVLVSGSGRLPCKAVIHAVGPMYRGGSSGEEECLYETVMKCMETVNNAGHSSIAFPAISTGIFGFPSKAATTIIVEAVKAFFDSRKRPIVKTVCLCHLETDIVQLFIAALRKFFPSAFSAPAYSKPKPSPRRGPQTNPKYDSRMVAQQDVEAYRRNVKVSIVSGEIAKQNAQVIVNSTSNGLDLHNGAVSSSILKAAGTGLQDECKAKYPGGIEVGDIAQTTGHNLNCSEVFHIVLCNHSNPAAQQILNQVVIRCLEAASRQGYKSLAFPVLGTGNLGYPAPLVAQTMLGAVDQFERKNPSTSLTDVRIVVYPADTRNLKVFKNALTGNFSGSSHPLKSSDIRKTRVFSAEESSQSTRAEQRDSRGASATSAEFDIGGLRLVIKKGDITEENTEAIVNSTNEQLDLSRGGVANALRKKCGSQLESECRSKVTDIQKHGIAQTKAYALNSKIIFHIDAERFSSGWEDGIELCLKSAEKAGARSIAMPALGTGIGTSPSSSAASLFKAVVKMYKHGNKGNSLQEVRVVLFDTKMIPPFVTAIQHMGEKHNSTHKGVVNFFKSVFTGAAVEVKQTFSNTLLDRASLFIYAGKQSSIDEALKSFKEMAEEKFTRKEKHEDIVTTLEQEEMDTLRQIAQNCYVELQIQPFMGRIVYDGLHDDVFECMLRISECLREIERKREYDKTAAILANVIQWSYLEVTTTGTEKREYGQKENRIIEMAFGNKEKCAKIVDNGGNTYIINFDTMEEYPVLDPADTVSVIRTDKIKDLSVGKLPDTWETHNANETVKLVPLKATDQEYQDVENGFKATAGNVTISNIERIQNPHLYHQYVAKKAHLEKQNPGIQNEKCLWHGTSSDAVDNINHYGFNRSYCGKNATVHGQGVYFAVNANYSASTTYSPPDASGNRRVYQCKVLVGQPTKGNQNLRVLPPRQGSILFDSATDNPNRPSMYVIFNDTQAYPDYLVTFS